MVSPREAIEGADLDEFGKALAPDVVWIGLWPGELCRSREQVLTLLERARANGRRMTPEIVSERGDLLVVDPHLADSARHQVFVLQDGLVSEIRAYPDRAAALAAAEGRPW
jgi:ketosteroid isomerase-like protein